MFTYPQVELFDTIDSGWLCRKFSAIDFVDEFIIMVVPEHPLRLGNCLLTIVCDDPQTGNHDCRNDDFVHVHTFLLDS